MVAWVVAQLSDVSYTYGRIDAPIASLTVDATALIDDAKLNTTFSAGNLPTGFRASFSEDGTSFVLSVLSSNNSDLEANAFYTEDSGATFTNVDLTSIVAPSQGIAASDEPHLFTVLVDALNFSKWIVIHRPTTGIYTVSYTVDKGVTFKRLDTLANHGLNVSTGTTATLPITPLISFTISNMYNGYWMWPVQNRLAALRINDDGTVETYGFIYHAPDSLSTYYWTDLSADGLSFGVGTLSSASEHLGSGTGSIAKYLPAAPSLNSKILADGV